MTTSQDLENLITFVYSLRAKPFHNLTNYVNTISDCSNLFSIAVQLAGKMVLALLDSGSSVTLMSDNFYKSLSSKLKPPLQQYKGQPLHSATWHFIAILGKSEIPILVGHFTTTLPFLVV